MWGPRERVILLAPFFPWEAQRAYYDIALTDGNDCQCLKEPGASRGKTQRCTVSPAFTVYLVPPAGWKGPTSPMSSSAAQKHLRRLSQLPEVRHIIRRGDAGNCSSSPSDRS
ncbi:hypothetical protein SKAU_G00394890 [Synaphobranchus kaupii]|uniref:Uncharacterized protein n=1 Tax=Synaphobranchus kaupii TaxID=118154 RepID=A0A9Q1EC97_SYNKA|nr:hypothetical protein SKAU_G00394890 [Synaphobranchus kaupii]